MGLVDRLLHVTYEWVGSLLVNVGKHTLVLYDPMGFRDTKYLQIHPICYISKTVRAGFLQRYCRTDFNEEVPCQLGAAITCRVTGCLEDWL